MLALPTLDGIPHTLGATGGHPVAARLALGFAGDAPLAGLVNGIGVEEKALEAQLAAWAERMAKRLRFTRFGAHITVRDDFSLWLGAAGDEDRYDPGKVFHLERRWAEVEALCHGLAAAALSAIDHAAGLAFPVFTPRMAHDMAVFVWWHGMDTDAAVRAEYDGEDPQDIEERLALPSAFDKAIPKAVHRARAMPARDLQRAAQGRGERAEIARATLALRQAATTACKRSPKHLFSDQHDDTHCMSFAATLRWNGRDPMFHVLDDQLHDMLEAVAVESAYCFCVADDAGQMPAMLAEAERVVELARQVEDLVAMVATPARA